MLNFNDNNKSANLSGTSFVSRIKAVLAAGVLFLAICTGCKAKTKGSYVFLYQLNDHEIILFDSNCRISFNDPEYGDSGFVCIFMDIDNPRMRTNVKPTNDLVSYAGANNYISVGNDDITLVALGSESYEVAYQLASSMVGPNGQIYYYKDYFEETLGSSRG